MARVLEEIGESFLDYGIAAARQQDLRSDLAEIPQTMATVPYLANDVVDISGLASIATPLRAPLAATR